MESDQHKGLVEGLRSLVPAADVRFCVRHLYANFRDKGFSGIKLKNKLWKAARAYAKHEHDSLKTSFGIYGVTLFLILLGRAAFVFPLSTLSNHMSSSAEKSPITFTHLVKSLCSSPCWDNISLLVIIWWAGLTWGAVSVALAFKQFTFSGVTWDPVDATMITSTVVIVLFSTLLVAGSFVSLRLSQQKQEISRKGNRPRSNTTIGSVQKAKHTLQGQTLPVTRAVETINSRFVPIDRTTSPMVFGILTKPLTEALVPHRGQGKIDHQNTKSCEEGGPTLLILSQENQLGRKY